MIKMSPFVVSIALLAGLSVAHADVSHLANGNNGYFYPNLGASALHTPEHPPSTQYANFGDNLISSNLANSYSPLPSGSPFGNAASLASKTYSSLRLSAPLQSPLLAGQKYQSQSQTNYQQQQQHQQAQTRNYPYQNQNQVASTSNAYSQAQQQQQQQQPQAPAYQAPTFQNQGTSTNAYSQTQVRSQEPIITKHFFVHAAPEDPEEETAPRYVQVGQPRKNYKIIFIKAPTYSSNSRIIPILPQNEEKTIVYVLSKKPSFEQNVELPELPVTEPSKPDVFFIKYKNQQEAEQAQQSIQAAYDQANLASADSADQIASQFVTDTDSATAFGGQDPTQQNQLGGRSSSTTQVKRFAQRRF